MARLREIIGRLRDQRGQSLTEFAIIAPVIVTILVFAIYFYEVTQIKLKQQEAERYVAWEFTGKQLSDYGDPDPRQKASELYSEARNEIIADAVLRFDNLNSTNKSHNQRRYVMAEWDVLPPLVRNTKPPVLPGGALVNLVYAVFKVLFVMWDADRFSTTNPIYQAMMLGTEQERGALYDQFGTKEWRFNEKGFVGVKMRWRVRPSLAFTKSFMDDCMKPFRPFNAIWLDDHASPDGINLIVDSWYLQDGRSIRGEYQADRGTAYWKQVDRMAFVNSSTKGVARGYSRYVTSLANFVAMLCIRQQLEVDPMETALAARIYRQDGGRVISGPRRLATDCGARNFDTAPNDGPYSEALNKRGDNFMGCPEAGVLGCNRTLGSENPFGDFIVPEENQ